MKKDTITLELTNFVCRGYVEVTTWDNTDGAIGMNPFTVPELTDKTIIAGINDGEFGAQSINKATVSIYKNYQGHHILLEEREYFREQLINCRTGIKSE